MDKYYRLASFNLQVNICLIVISIFKKLLSEQDYFHQLVKENQILSHLALSHIIYFGNYEQTVLCF